MSHEQGKVVKRTLQDAGATKNVRTDEDAEFVLAVLDAECATVDQLRRALAARRDSRPPIGQIAVECRQLSVAEVFRVLEEQAVSNSPFGQLAVELGFLNPSELDDLLRRQIDCTPAISELLVTRGVLTVEQGKTISEQVELRLKRNNLTIA
jgi:hypothetical protein